mmetsp:Transcript_61986/g.145367  ORF Transcript_61986/g.145367 Transcript_61986/m.145367 type:complete len:226 (-) Transcript_61986:1692-2369(-)
MQRRHSCLEGGHGPCIQRGPAVFPQGLVGSEPTQPLCSILLQPRLGVLPQLADVNLLRALHPNEEELSHVLIQDDGVVAWNRFHDLCEQQKHLHHLQSVLVIHERDVEAAGTLLRHASNGANKAPQGHGFVLALARDADVDEAEMLGQLGIVPSVVPVGPKDAGAQCQHLDGEADQQENTQDEDRHGVRCFPLDMAYQGGLEDASIGTAICHGLLMAHARMGTAP